MGANWGFYNSPNAWPYTNFHELNLDWILEKLKEQETNLTTARKAIDSTNERIDQTNTNVSNLSTQNQATLQVALKGRPVYNLFDNSYFVNPVNQRGEKSYTGAGYTIDRWKKENESGIFTIGNNYIAMTGTGAYWFLTQFVPTNKIKSGAVYTIALADTSGNISVCSTVFSTDMAKFTAPHTFTNGAVVTTNAEYRSDKYAVCFTSNSSAETRCAWAALYEGYYTADTLPAHVQKGYATELLECQRYYYQVMDTSIILPGIGDGNGCVDTIFPLPVKMRTIPTLTAKAYPNDSFAGDGKAELLTDGIYSTVDVSSYYKSNSFISVRYVDPTMVNKSCSLLFRFTVSADL